MRLGVFRSIICGLALLVSAAPAGAHVSLQAFTGDRLAYVSAGSLYVGYPRARLVPGPGNAYQPVFSHDGRWLAFLRQRWQGDNVTSQLWVARADGSAARAITSVGVSAGSFQWSPSADVLAVQPVSAKGAALPIRLIPVQGPEHTVPNGLRGSFLWLPDGKTLAIVATARSGYTRLDLVRGTTLRSYSVPGVGRNDPIKLAAWWPAATSLVYWRDPAGCSSCIADGTPLYAFNLRTRATRRLGVGLAYRDWIAVSGSHLLAVMGLDRSAFFGKHIEICSTARPCRTLLTSRAGTITLDPAWSPAGNGMAFISAPAWKTWGFRNPARYRRWLRAHVLWTARTDGSGAARAGAEVPAGAQDPEWTRDGRGILFVRDGALWLDPHLGAANPTPIARLVPSHAAPGLRRPAFQGWYYGHMDWHDLFAWY